jgi:hypothetical protein
VVLVSTNNEYKLLSLMTTAEGSKVVESGITGALFHEPIASAAFRYALDYWEQHNRPPTADVLEKGVPGIGRHLPEQVDEATSWLIDELRDWHGHCESQDDITKILKESARNGRSPDGVKIGDVAVVSPPSSSEDTASHAHGSWRAYQAAVDAGRLVERIGKPFDHSVRGWVMPDPQVRVTVKGLGDILQRLTGDGELAAELLA